MVIRKESDDCFHCPKCECAFRHNLRAWLFVGIPFGLLVGTLFFDILGFGKVPETFFWVLMGVCMLVVFLSPEWYVITNPGMREKGAIAPTSVFFKLLNSLHGRLVLYLVPGGTIMSLYCLVRLALAFFSWRTGQTDYEEWSFRYHEFGPLLLVTFLVTTPGYIALFLDWKKKRERKQRDEKRSG
jgi:hypothetical protein